MRTLFRYISTAVLSLILVLLYFTAETVAEELGWVAFVRAVVQNGVSAIVASGYSVWLWWAFLFMSGVTLTLWIDFLVRRKSAPFKVVNTIENKVMGKHFNKEVVPLDGYSYRKCKFNQVTFLYNGGKFELVENSINQYRLISGNPQIDKYVTLMAEFKMISVPINSRDGDVKFTGMKSAQ